MNIINLMPIPITYAPNGNLENKIVFPTSGRIARLWEADKADIKIYFDDIILDVCQQQLLWVGYIVESGVEDIPANRHSLYEYMSGVSSDDNDTLFIVNNLVAQRIVLGWKQFVISPATSNDGIIREDGKIIAITKFNQFL